MDPSGTVRGNRGSYPDSFGQNSQFGVIQVSGLLAPYSPRAGEHATRQTAERNFGWQQCFLPFAV